ncbi:MAG: hypothetical protein ACI8RD_005737, partial [Bacillariaceae sp.]|jgi:hypothetical protein
VSGKIFIYKYTMLSFCNVILFPRVSSYQLFSYFSFPYIRHGQMNSALIDAFEDRATAVHRYVSGEISQQKIQPPQQIMMNNQFQQQGQAGMMNDIQPLNDTGGMGGMGMNMGGMGGMDMFGGAGGMENLVASMNNGGAMGMRGSMVGSVNMGSVNNNMRNQQHQQQYQNPNPPVVSFGNHRMSLMGQLQQNPNARMSLMGRMSEVSYGRAMSGLSALSIDWENMDDFDVNVDHSEHINNAAAVAAASAMGRGGQGNVGNVGNRGSGGPRVASRSSMRHPSIQSGGTDNSDSHVQFKL